MGHIHFISKLGVRCVSLSSGEGGGDCITLIECQEYQTKSRKSEIQNSLENK